MKDYFLLSLRNLRKRGIRSWLTMLGIFLGIAAVVSLISLGQGLQTAITGQFATLDTDRLIITSAETGFGPPGSTATRKLNDDDLKIVESVSGVKSALARLVRVARLEFNDEVRFDYVVSMPEDSAEIDLIYNSFNMDASQGRLLRLQDKGRVLLGDDFLKEDFFGKNLKLGDKINVQGRDFEIIGFLKRTGTFTINGAVFMLEDEMKDVLDIGDEIDLIAVQVEDEDEINQVAEEVKRKIRRDRDQKPGEEDFSIQTPVQALESVNTILNVINVVVSGIAGISLLIGGIGIANTMFTSVLERTKEIGVMKAIGAQNRDVLSIFLIEAGLLGLVGGLIGAVIGLGLAFGVSGIANASFNDDILQVSVSYSLLLASISFSLLIGIISGIVPAYQASRLSPVEALRR